MYTILFLALYKTTVDALFFNLGITGRETHNK